VFWLIAMKDGSENLTQLLLAWSRGDDAARDELIPLIYDTLRRIARRQLRGERASHTLESTELINEAYLKLSEQPISWESRAHFFGIAARLMRQLLVDNARSRQRFKRGGDLQQISITAASRIPQYEAMDLLPLDEALKSLAEVDPQRGRIVELRFFGGLTIEETAYVMGISTPTVERGWRAARAWLQTELSQSVSKHDPRTLAKN
jgi:RNA polymerase sigma factor (TIGR02999 family)